MIKGTRLLGALGFIALALTATDGLGSNDYRGSMDETLKAIASNAIVDPAAVAAPMGRFILIRVDAGRCAVRFTSLRRGHDEKPPTSFNSGEESLFAEADLYQQKGESGEFSRNAKTKHLALSQTALIGIGKLAFGGGSAIKCGGVRISWGFPTWVGLSVGSGGPKDKGRLELAPTAWSEISQIDFSSPQLTWYGYDEARKAKVIPLSELPGGNTPAH